MSEGYGPGPAIADRSVGDSSECKDRSVSNSPTRQVNAQSFMLQLLERLGVNCGQSRDTYH